MCISNKCLGDAKAAFALRVLHFENHGVGEAREPGTATVPCHDEV